MKGPQNGVSQHGLASLQGPLYKELCQANRLRVLRQPTAVAAAALLETARETWTLYGNESMLHKIDLHLSELPQPAGERGGPEADRLVKVLHVARELNREFDRDKLLGLILDRAIELTGAERGFVILLEDGREQVRIARNIDREAISEPELKLSSQVVSGSTMGSSSAYKSLRRRFESLSRWSISSTT